MALRIYSTLLFNSGVAFAGPIRTPEDVDTIVLRDIVARHGGGFGSALEGQFVPGLQLLIGGDLLTGVTVWEPGDGFPLGFTDYEWRGRIVVPPSTSILANVTDDNWTLSVSGYLLSPT